MNMKKKHDKRRILANIMTLIFLCVFLFSLYKVVGILKEYREIDELYDQTSENYLTEAEDEPNKITPDVDLESLREINTDVIGWIYIPDTDISFPLLQGKSNKQYLYQSYKKEYLTAGSIYLDYRCNADLEDKNTVIYGHNMHNGSMFGSLKKYKNEEYRDKHPYIYLMKTDGSWNKYEAVAYYQAAVDGPTYVLPLREPESDSGESGDKDNEIKTSSSTAEDFNTLIDTIKSSSVYETEADINEADKLITLSTCTQDSRNDVRMILAAKLVETIK